MKYDMYVFDRKRDYCITPNGIPIKVSSDAELLDTIALMYMDEDQRITRTTPIYRGNDDIRIAIYPQFTNHGLVLNKKTLKVRRVYSVGTEHLLLFNTDDRQKTHMQEYGYIFSKYTSVSKEDWIPLEESEDNSYEIYYPNSSIGKDPDFDRMEYEGMMSL